MSRYILAIDQGTTSSRAILFDEQGRPRSRAQQELTQYYPADGWIEHDAEEIWHTTCQVCREALASEGISAASVAAIGITNQRETSVIWDRATGEPIHKAIVWQDRRTAETCQRLRADGLEAEVQAKTGLLLDPYFSATKIQWLLDNVPGARERAANGELAFGTMDSFLLWRFTKGAAHKTDATNASRTLLFNIHTQQWDESLLAALNVPQALLPEVADNSADFGTADPEWLGASVPIAGMAGDQQAALFGQACFHPGMVKSTYGTGCFLLMNLGEQAPVSQHRLLTTVGYRLNGRVAYACEGSIFVAGAAVQWLRDGLGLIREAGETEPLARAAGYHHGVYMVPAFTGLGAPYWDPDARGAILGMNRDTGAAQLASATLQSVGYQTADLVAAMQADGAYAPLDIRVDGGMVVNDWVVQFLADILGAPVERPDVTETTALGAAYLAGLQTGVFESTRAIEGLWQSERRFQPALADEQRRQLYAGWCDAVARSRSGA